MQRQYPHMAEEPLKQAVKQHWEEEVCGIRYGESSSREEWLREIEKARYELEPHIHGFADFQGARGKKVLEIGVGAGSDFANWIKNGAQATGVDLTDAAISLTKERLDMLNVDSAHYRLVPGDAEAVPFPNEEFDIVYSWGVLHHTPNTEQAVREVFRVLKPGGKAKIMIYHVPSWTGFLLWTRHHLMKGKVWKSPRKAIFDFLESPGTKAYTVREAREMMQRVGFQNVDLRTKLCPGDLLTIKPSKKYQGAFYKLVWKLYPKWLVRALGDRFGLELLIEGAKPL